MTDQAIVHSSFTIERTYRTDAADLWRAWTDRQRKASWFAPTVHEYTLDVSVGGIERLDTVNEKGALHFESRYLDVVERARLVYTSTLNIDGRTATASLTTVEFAERHGSVSLVLTEQDAFLDGLEEPDWRRAGTESWLDALGRHVEAGPQA